MMIRFNLFIISVVFSAVTIFSQTTYYVSSSQGNDSNSGTSESDPFESISKINGLNLKPGDKVLFKSGDIWEGQNLIIKNSGTESNRIVFSSYGSGAKPIITLREEVPGWKTASNWTKYSDNVWVMSFLSSQIIQRLWMDNKEVLFSNGINGDNMDGTGSGINNTHVFFHDQNNGKLYISSNSNPADNYSSIKYPGKVENGKVIYLTVAFSDADNIVFEGLDIQGGMYASVGLGGSDNALIKNCDIGRYSNWTAIMGNSGYAGATDQTSDYVEITNCTVDSYWTYPYVFYTQITPYGIVPGSSTSHWDIHDNYIKNWWFGVLAVGFTAPSQYHNIYDNEITAPNYSFTKAVQISTRIFNGNAHQGIKVYDNYFHDLTHGLQIQSNGNMIFNNIISNLEPSTNEHASKSNSGWGIMLQTEANYPDCDSNIVFNNTFYNLTNQAIVSSSKNGLFVNNIFANCNLQNEWSHTQVQVSKYATDIWQNNIFYYTGLSSNDVMISMPDVGTFTVAEWNKVNGKYNKTISGNLQYTGNISSLLNIDDFSLPDNSIARNAGIDITSLLTESVKNLISLLINSTAPNIGAVNNTTQAPTGLKIFLEGPYGHGTMSTGLNDEGLIPKSQPYNVSPWNYSGNESVSDIPKDIVDWVLVELRNPLSPSSIIAQKAAFLRKDGSITALDGISKLSFGNLTGAYYVAVKHRNHLAVISSLPVLLVNGNLLYDFTTSASKAGGSNAMAELESGVYGMYGGDTDGDGVIDDKDVSDVSSNLFKAGYQKEDVNLNSPVNVLDYKLPNENKSKSSQAAE